MSFKVEFYIAGEFIPGTAIEKCWPREVAHVPREGEKIAWHRQGETKRYKVVEVLWVYEDRPDYKKDYGDTICVRLVELLVPTETP